MVGIWAENLFGLEWEGDVGEDSERWESVHHSNSETFNPYYACVNYLTVTSAKSIVNTLTCYLSVVRLLLGYKLLQIGIQINMSGKNVFLIILFPMIIITMVVREVEEVERDMGRVAGLIGGAGAK